MQSRRSTDGIIFDLFMLAIVVTLMVTALGLSRGARLVPLLIGVPTVVALLYQLATDLFPRLRRRRRTAAGTRAAPELSADDPAPRAAAVPAVPDVHLADVLISGKDAEDLSETPEAVRRELLFGLWIVGFFALTLLGGYIVSIPIALFVIYRVFNRESWTLSLGITLGTWAIIYVLFAIILRVPLAFGTLFS